VHVRRRGVARGAVVHHDHRPALPDELERGGEPGGRPADDRHVAAADDGRLAVVLVLGVVVRGVRHATTVGASGVFRMPSCTIRKIARS
jgi:hypothetical protein